MPMNYAHVETFEEKSWISPPIWCFAYEPLLHDGGRIAGDHRGHRAAQQDGTAGAAEVVAIQGQGNLGARVSGDGQ